MMPGLLKGKLKMVQIIRRKVLQRQEQRRSNRYRLELRWPIMKQKRELICLGRVKWGLATQRPAQLFCLFCEIAILWKLQEEVQGLVKGELSIKQRSSGKPLR